MSYLKMQLKTPPTSPPHFAFINVNEALQEAGHHNPLHPKTQIWSLVHICTPVLIQYGAFRFKVEPAERYHFSMKENFSNRNRHFVLCLIGGEK